jgi:hypothetical protein
MPVGAERLMAESVPAEFNQIFENFLKYGAGKIAGADREVLAWMGNYKNAAIATKLVSQIQTNFRTAGWQFESTGRNGDVEVFTLLKEGSPRRLVFGFFVPTDKVLVCALMEAVRADAPVAAKNTLTNSTNNQTTPFEFIGRRANGFECRP